MIRRASVTCGRQSLVKFRAASTTTVDAAKEHKSHQAPQGTHHVRAAHHVTCCAQTFRYRLKPEMREAQLLHWARRAMPHFLHVAQGKMLGVPGPRGLGFRDDKTHEYTCMDLWESAEAMEMQSKKPEHQKIMSEFDAYVDPDSIQVEVHPHTDVLYYASMPQSNWERYPIEVGHWPMKPGTRQQCVKILAENKNLLQWCHDAGVLVLVLKYNEAQDHCISHTVIKDLLKWETMHKDFGRKLTEWGLAEHLAIPNLDEACSQIPPPFSNAWVYSE